MFPMRLAFMLTALLALTACSSTSPTAPASGAAPAPASSFAADEASCAAAGGELKPLGRLQRMQCVVPYADAGKVCSAKSDCTGQCLAEGDSEIAPGTKATGVCQRDVSQNFGCRQRIDGGVAQGTICVD
jgi:putative hemolysin